MARYKKRSDGRYSTSVWDGTYKDGKKCRRTLYAKTIRELDAKVREMERQVQEGNYIQRGDVTFLSFAAGWFDSQKANASANTKQMYRDIIERYLSAEPDVKMEDLRYIHVKRILDRVEGKKNTQGKIIMTIKQIVKQAVREQRYQEREATILFECLPKVKLESKEKRILTAKEKAAVFRVELPQRERCFLYLIYGCGLRREEALALTPFDFDFAAGTVKITKALVLLDGAKTDLKATKSVNGRRTVPMPERIKRVVEDYARTCSGGLFPGMTKTRYRTLWRHVRDAFREYCPDTADTLTAHIFRHNYCTELCYQIPTISLKNVARLLGDTEQMVLNVYSHIDLDREPTRAVISSVF